MKRKRKTKQYGDPAPPTLKAQQLKVRKLWQMVGELESGEQFKITRLVTIKSLCQDVKTAARFTLLLAQQAQTRKDWNTDRQFFSAAAVKQHKQLATDALALIEQYLTRRSDARADQLRELLWQAREVNNEYRNIPYGAVRSIKSKRALIVEQAIYCALAYDATTAGYWAYQAARDFAEVYAPRYGSGLLPESAPLVALIAEFWQAHYFVET